MKQLMNSRLFSLLEETSQNKDQLIEMKSAYEEFALKLLDKLKTETSLTELYYNLGFVRLELTEICNNLSDRKEKKCPYFWK